MESSGTVVSSPSAKVFTLVMDVSDCPGKGSGSQEIKEINKKLKEHNLNKVRITLKFRLDVVLKLQLDPIPGFLPVLKK